MRGAIAASPRIEAPDWNSSDTSAAADPSGSAPRGSRGEVEAKPRPRPSPRSGNLRLSPGDRATPKRIGPARPPTRAAARLRTDRDATVLVRGPDQDLAVAEQREQMLRPRSASPVSRSRQPPMPPRPHPRQPLHAALAVRASSRAASVGRSEQRAAASTNTAAAVAARTRVRRTMRRHEPASEQGDQRDGEKPRAEAEPVDEPRLLGRGAGEGAATGRPQGARNARARRRGRTPRRA